MTPGLVSIFVKLFSFKLIFFWHIFNLIIVSKALLYEYEISVISYGHLNMGEFLLGHPVVQACNFCAHRESLLHET